jgi:hypothetical protein
MGVMPENERQTRELSHIDRVTVVLLNDSCLILRFGANWLQIFKNFSLSPRPGGTFSGLFRIRNTPAYSESLVIPHSGSRPLQIQGSATFSPE